MKKDNYKKPHLPFLFLKLLLPDQDPGAAQGVRDRPRRVGQDRDAEVHRLYQRHTEPLMLAQAEIDRGQLEVGEEFGVGDVAGEDDVFEFKFLDDRSQVAEIRLGTFMEADQEEPSIGLE